MRNLADKWSPIPDWASAAVDAPGWTVRTVGGLRQLLVSGDLDAWSRTAGMADSPVGAFGAVDGDAYAVRLARDRVLAVSTGDFTLTPGWHPDGFAVTAVNAGLHVFDIEGSSSRGLMARATTLDLDAASPSAAISFAGLDAMVYRYGRAFRVHVDSSFAPYLWRWFQQQASEETLSLDGAPSPDPR